MTIAVESWTSTLFLYQHVYNVITLHGLKDFTFNQRLVQLGIDPTHPSLSAEPLGRASRVTIMALSLNLFAPSSIVSRSHRGMIISLFVSAGSQLGLLNQFVSTYIVRIYLLESRDNQIYQLKFAFGNYTNILLSDSRDMVKVRLCCRVAGDLVLSGMLY